MRFKIVALILMLSTAAMPGKPLMAAEPQAVGNAFSTTAGMASDVPELQTIPEQKEERKMKYLIKKMQVPHCKRGPERCEICRKTNEPRWCLLDIDPPDKEMVQRPVLDLTIDGERHFLVYDVIKSFDSEEEAGKFLSENDFPGLIWDK
ncbi:MAG: hypothetical protein A2W80_17790 [Candidatus Riflebacteria bacterium GWC2_50_8]|nr:MAG: hypothetical protein A2W80_17790 [Candidatus Riflebacteria bacterium GWC2_50_8]